MKSRLKIKKELTGKKIDINWMKYKVYRNKKYLIKLNALINQLVSIDKELEKEKLIKPHKK